MILDIRTELEILAAFFRRQASWITLDRAKIPPGLSEEAVEDFFTGIEGPATVEELVCRITVNELNALVEACLQDTLTRFNDGCAIFDLAPNDSIPKPKHVYYFNRKELDEALKLAGVPLESCAGYVGAVHIKEIAEGNKHRERHRHVLNWDRKGRFLEKRSVVPGSDGESFYSAYELSLAQVRDYLELATQFCDALLKLGPHDSRR